MPVVHRILLVRHGRSSHLPLGWVDRAGFDAWLAAYDVAGLAANERAPVALRALAREGQVVSSDMPRAIESVRLLAADAEGAAAPRHSPLLRETAVPMPDFGRVRLPMLGWAVCAGARWFAQLRRESATTPTPERRRAAEAAGWLAALAAEREPVLVVTHGLFRHYLADALEHDGWARGRAPRRRHHWSAWELERGVGLGAGLGGGV